MNAPTISTEAGLFEEIAPEAWERGAALAIECLEASSDLDRSCMCNEGRAGAPQDNVLYLYLLRLRQEADPQVEQAFCSVLTDYIASAVCGSTWDVESIEGQARESGPVAQAVRPMSNCEY